MDRLHRPVRRGRAGLRDARRRRRAFSDKDRKLYVLTIADRKLVKVADDNPYRLLQHKTDPVTLTVNSKPSDKGARKVT